MTIQKRASSIAVIGAGASGSVAADVLVKEKAFSKVKVFERKPKAGGVWILDEIPDQIQVRPGTTEAFNDPQLPIPVELASVESGTQIITQRSTTPRFINTPAYEFIRTNVPEHFMTFSDKPTWKVLDKPDIDPFTSRNYVEEYIEEYIQPHDDIVVYNTTLERVDKDYSDPDSTFVLTLRKESVNENGNIVNIWWKEEFDALVLATGHYHVPWIPKVKGLDQVLDKYPDRIKYAKQFRNDVFYKDKTVIVVGGSASGIDISNVVSKIARKVYRSEHLGSQKVKARETAREVVLKPVVEKYVVTDNGFDAIFDDGTVIKNPDYIIYGTGYDYSYPFLRHLWPNFSANGVYLPNNFQHTFHIQDPKISTPGVPVGALSFRCFEYQSVLISRYLAGKIQLPTQEQQYAWVKEREETVGKNRSYHKIGGNNVVAYLKDLTELGGGVEKLGENGRPFPIITQDQVDEWVVKKDALIERLEEESPGILNTFEAIN